MQNRQIRNRLLGSVKDSVGERLMESYAKAVKTGFGYPPSIKRDKQERPEERILPKDPYAAVYMPKASQQDSSEDKP